MPKNTIPLKDRNTYILDMINILHICMAFPDLFDLIGVHVKLKKDLSEKDIGSVLKFPIDSNLFMELFDHEYTANHFSLGNIETMNIFRKHFQEYLKESDSIKLKKEDSDI